MSDNLRRYRAIRDALTQCYPGQPSGTVARHLITLAALISGIVGSKSTQLPHIAAQVPNGTKLESRAKHMGAVQLTPALVGRIDRLEQGELVPKRLDPATGRFQERPQ